MIAWDQIGLTTVFLTSDVDLSGEETNLDESGEEKETETAVEDTENTEAENVEGEKAEDELEAEDTEGKDALGTEEVPAEGEIGESEMGEGETGEAGMDGMVEGDMDGMMNAEVQTAKDPLLSNPIAFGGISVAVFVVGGLLGLLLAKKKIKKGIELYEDI